MRRRLTVALIVIIVSMLACARLTRQPPADEKQARQDFTYGEMRDLLARTSSFSCQMKFQERGEAEVTSEVVPPDRSHTVARARFADLLDKEVIVIGSSVYELQGGAAKWETRSVETGRTNVDDFMNGYFGYMIPLYYYPLKLAGTEVLDGTTALVYEDSGSPQNPELHYLKAWVRASDRLPLKVVFNNKDMKPRCTAKFYDYDKKIKIEPPSM